jgi:hypothetical protein
MLAPLAIACCLALAHPGADTVIVGDELAPAEIQAEAESVEAEPIIPLEDFTSESGWLARWRSDHQRRAAETATMIQTDRPTFTLSDTTVPQGWVQLESGVAFSNYSDDSVFARTTSGPQLNLRVGLTPWVELRLQWWGVASNSVTIYNAGGDSHYQRTSSSDMQVGLKLKGNEQRGLLPRTAFVTSLVLPTGSYGHDVGVVLDEIYTWQLGERWTVGGSTLGAFSNHLSQIYTSAIAKYYITPTFNSFYEFYVGADSHDWSTYYPAIDLGFQWRPLQNLQLDLRTGMVGNTELPEPSPFVDLGLSARY